MDDLLSNNEGLEYLKGHSNKDVIVRCYRSKYSYIIGIIQYSDNTVSSSSHDSYADMSVFYSMIISNF